MFPWMNSGNLHDYISSEANGHLNDGEIRRLVSPRAYQNMIPNWLTPKKDEGDCTRHGIPAL